MTQPAHPSTGLRVGGIILIVFGVLPILCGVGYGIAYYTTQGFFDVEGADALADLRYGNLAVAGSGLCCGAAFIVAGVAMLVSAKRRGAQPGTAAG
ncbi:hypothetical protein [Dactylosporangium sp. CA-139066]|uniref:hypothetical protein n=1 Tax=Dactylosporangium sp. CA-139066 TaxID=3239930 RepID=UPI003D917C16